MPLKEDTDTHMHKSSFQIPDRHTEHISDRFFNVESQGNKYLIEICNLYCIRRSIVTLKGEEDLV